MKKLKIIFIFAILLFANVLLLEKVPAPPSCNLICQGDGYVSGACAFDDGGTACDGGCTIEGCNAGPNPICEIDESCYCYGTCTPGCSFSHDCLSGEYCEVDGDCLDLQTCAEANTGTGYNTQESTEDLWGDCGTTGTCNNQYTRTTHNGLCSGSSYSCQSSTGGITTGDVCQSGNSVNPSGSTNCGTGSQACYCDNDWYQCDTVNDCTYDQYYVGFTGSGTCTETGKVLRVSNVANTNPNRCKIASTTAYLLSSSVWDTNTCASNSYCNSGVCTNQCPTLATNKFVVKNSIGSSCLEVDTSGNAIIHGVLTQSCSTIPPIDSFIIKFGTNVRGWVRASNCDMCLYATVSTSQSISFAAPDGFYVKNSVGTYVMKLDTSGILKFAGNACYDYDSGAATKL